jgi:membrane protease YdiL (CAAX protease family)
MLMAVGLGSTELSPTSSGGHVRIVIGMALAAAVSIGGFEVISRRLRNRPPAELRGPGMWRQLGVGGVLGGAPVALAVGFLAVIGVYRSSDVSLNWGIASGLMIGVGAAAMEEVFFRGIVLRAVVLRFGPWPGIVGVGLLFGALHVTNPGVGLWGAAGIVLASWMLDVAYVVTGKLWVSLSCHATWNFALSGVFGTDVSGMGTGRGLLSSQLVGANWLTGGATGLEGSVVLVVLGFATGLTVVWWAVRTGHLGARRAPSVT